MYEIMSSDEAIRLIRDGDCIAVNSFVGIENPVELHEAIYRRYQKMQSPRHLTMVSSAGFGTWDENRNAEGYIREGAVDRLICGHFGAMPSTKKIVMEDRFEAYNLPLGCISHAIRAQAGGLPGALSKVGLDIFVDPRKEGPGINRISIDDSLVKYVEVDGEENLIESSMLPAGTYVRTTGQTREGKTGISYSVNQRDPLYGYINGGVIVSAAVTITLPSGRKVTVSDALVRSRTALNLYLEMEYGESYGNSATYTDGNGNTHEIGNESALEDLSKINGDMAYFNGLTAAYIANGAYTKTFYTDDAGKETEVEVRYMGLARSNVVIDGKPRLVDGTAVHPARRRRGRRP